MRSAARTASLAVTGLLLALGAPPLAAQWRAGTSVDPGSLDEIPAALVENTDGFRFAVFRDAQEQILGSFTLPAGDPDFLDASRSPILRIDGGPPQQLLRRSGELKSVGFLLWGGPGEPLVGVIRDLMDGATATLEYPLFGGGHKLTRFALAGASQTIAEVVGIAAEVGPEERALALSRDAALTRCLELEKSKQQKRCLDRLLQCSESSPESVEALAACLEERR